MTKKKKTLLIVLAIVLLVVLIIAGVTLSKYFQTINGSASTQIASWSFKANAGSEAITDITLESSDGEKIAPGSSGSFQIKVDATGSDVDVDYSVNVSSEKLPTNMIFYIDEGDTYTSLNELASAKLTGTLTTSGSQTKTYTVYWNWPYESYDATSNALLDNEDMADAASTASYGFKLEILGVQAQS